MNRRRSGLRPRRRAWTFLLLVVVGALLAASCSDAHTTVERELTDDGTDPNLVHVYAPPALEPVLDQLGDVFAAQNSELRVVVVADVSKALSDRFSRGGLADLWFDVDTTIEPLAGDARMIKPPVPFGEDPLQLAVLAGNPTGVKDLTPFGPGPGPRTGLCSKTDRCGINGRKLLERNKIDPQPEGGTGTSAQVAGGLVDHKIDAALIYRTDVAARSDVLAVVPLPDADLFPIRYEMAQLSVQANTSLFAQWVTTDPTALAILTSFGLLPMTGKAP